MNPGQSSPFCACRMPGRRTVVAKPGLSFEARSAKNGPVHQRYGRHHGVRTPSQSGGLAERRACDCECTARQTRPTYGPERQLPGRRTVVAKPGLSFEARSAKNGPVCQRIVSAMVGEHPRGRAVWRRGGRRSEDLRRQTRPTYGPERRAWRFETPFGKRSFYFFASDSR